MEKEVNEVIDFYESLFDIPGLDDLVEPVLESVADSIPSTDTIKEPVIALVDSIPNVDVTVCENITQGMNGITDDLLLTDCLIEAIGLDINAIELDEFGMPKIKVAGIELVVLPDIVLKFWDDLQKEINDN